MNYPCGIIKDLLPLYIDEVCSIETGQAVEKHLAKCTKCREYYEAMKSTDGFAEDKSDHTEDIKMAGSLKNIKKTINKRIRNTVLCAVAAVLVVIAGFHLLMNAAIRNISPEDISVSADVYALAELIENPIENDNSKAIEVKIPELGTMKLPEDTVQKCEYATVISVGSEYFLRTIKSEVKDNTLYIRAFKTTLLNNKAQNYQKQFSYLELQEINQIVFIDGNAIETVLWSK